MASRDGDDWVFRYPEQVDCYIGAGAGSVSYLDYNVVLVSTHTEAPTTTTRYTPTVSKISTTQ